MDEPKGPSPKKRSFIGHWVPCMHSQVRVPSNDLVALWSVVHVRGWVFNDAGGPIYVLIGLVARKGLPGTPIRYAQGFSHCFCLALPCSALLDYHSVYKALPYHVFPFPKIVLVSLASVDWKPYSYDPTAMHKKASGVYMNIPIYHRIYAAPAMLNGPCLIINTQTNTWNWPWGQTSLRGQLTPAPLPTPTCPDDPAALLLLSPSHPKGTPAPPPIAAAPHHHFLRRQCAPLHPKGTPCS